MRRRIRLEWTVLAQADRDGIFEYIESDSPQAAITVDDRIREQVKTLARFPESGRPGRIEGTRELVISGTPYIVAYRITGNTVRVLRVLHGSRRWPDDMPEESQE
jgi:toxin ParE1/3/4